MTDNAHPLTAETAEERDIQLAQQQALKYGQDLARVFVAEKARRKELELAYKTLSAVFASIPDALVVLNGELRIQQVNPAFLRFFEVSADSPIDRPISEYLPSEGIEAALGNMIEAGAASQRVEFSLPPRLSLVVNIARLENGDQRGWVLVLHDETERKRMENQKAEFINIASHELRTPLTAIMGYAEIVQEDLKRVPADEEKYGRYVTALHRGAQRLKGIIDELVAFAQVNQGDVRPQGITSFAVSALVEDVVAELQPKALEHCVSLRTDLPFAPLDMRADPSLLRMALGQLILNGIGFNRPEGHVLVEVRQADSGEQVSIQVIDSGIGIAQKQIETIFQPFFQVENHETRATSGLGLGLSIVRRAVQQLGGTVTVQSKLDEGTTITMLLPIQQPSAERDIAELKKRLEATKQQTLSYARDIMTLYRQLQETNAQLEQVNNQLDEANKLKANFLGVITHELRSPFVPLDFALQAFPRFGVDRLAAEQRELLDQLNSGLAQARKMIDNLVAYAGLLSKQGRLNMEPVNIADLVEDVMLSLAPMARRRRLDVQMPIARDLVLPAGDRERISEAIWHLAHNAIKFTEPGGKVTFHAQTNDEALYLTVEDTGIGIPPEQQARLWDSFSQLSDPLKRGVEGLGLGLSLVRYVAVAHGGNVLLESTPGVGSRVGFWVPIRQRATDVSTAHEKERLNT